MKTSQWRRAVENRCVFGARLKALSDRSSDRSAGGRRSMWLVRWLRNFVVQLQSGFVEPVEWHLLHIADADDLRWVSEVRDSVNFWHVIIKRHTLLLCYFNLSAFCDTVVHNSKYRSRHYCSTVFEYHLIKLWNNITNFCLPDSKVISYVSIDCTIAVAINFASENFCGRAYYFTFTLQQWTDIVL